MSAQQNSPTGAPKAFMARAACPPAEVMTGSGFVQIRQGEVSSQNPEALQSCLFSGTQVSILDSTILDRWTPF